MLHTEMTVDEKLREYAKQNNKHQGVPMCSMLKFSNFDTWTWLQEHKYISTCICMTSLLSNASKEH